PRAPLRATSHSQAEPVGRSISSRFPPPRAQTNGHVEAESRSAPASPEISHLPPGRGPALRARSPESPRRRGEPALAPTRPHLDGRPLAEAARRHRRAPQPPRWSTTEAQRAAGGRQQIHHYAPDRAPPLGRERARLPGCFRRATI